MGRRHLFAGAAAVAAALAGLAILGGRRPAGSSLLWYEGRPVVWSGARGVVLDATGQVLTTGRGGRLEPLLVRSGGRTLLEVAPGGGRLWAVDGGGSVLRRESDGSLVEVGRTPFDIPTLRAAPGGNGGFWVARSARQFTFRPETTGAPAALRLDGKLATRLAAGAALIPANPFLAQLANAGHLVALPDGGVVFAPFIRDEVVRYDRRGRELWRLARGLTHATSDPRLIVSGGDVELDYAPVNLGAALGPDGRLYVLSTPSATTAASRLDAVDLDRGALVRTWGFGTALPTIAVDLAGRVRTPDPASLSPTVSAERREPFPPFDLPALRGGALRSVDLLGKVVLVNIWASWCAPCRVEMPALDSLARRQPKDRFAFVALSDDVSDADARRFIAEHGFSFAVGLGRGRLKRNYHYVGLPLTVLVDRRGRIVRRWSGFAGARQIEAIEALIEAELRRPEEASHHAH